MKKYSLAMFDFDGTVCDTGIGVMNAVRYSLEKFGITETDESRLRSFVGPPLAESYRRNYGMSPEESLNAVKIYREYYLPHGLYESHPYEGMKNALDSIKEGGICCAIASGKPVEMIHTLLRRYGLAGRFDFVSGFEDGREQKSDIILHLFDICDFDKSQAVMIGDRDNDARGAATAGVDFIACTYGYAEPGEFEPFNKVYTATSPAEIADFLLK